MCSGISIRMRYFWTEIDTYTRYVHSLLKLVVSFCDNKSNKYQLEYYIYLYLSRNFNFLHIYITSLL